MSYEEVMKAKSEYLGDGYWDLMLNTPMSPFMTCIFLSGIIVVIFILMNIFVFKKDIFAGNESRQLLISFYGALAICIPVLVKSPLLYEEPIERHKNYSKFETEIVEPYLLSMQPNVYYNLELVSLPRVVTHFQAKMKSKEGLTIDKKISLRHVEFRRLPAGETKSYIVQYELDKSIVGKYKKGYLKNIGYFTEEELQAINAYEGYNDYYKFTN